MKVALLHLSFCGGPMAVNEKKLLVAIDKAAQKGANWIITPEMALQGYFMVRTGAPYEFIHSGHPSFYKFSQKAREHGIFLFLSCGEEYEGKPYNSCIVIDKTGQIVGRHSKVKVVRWITENWAQEGKGFTPLLLGGKKVGILVCADAWFEEHGTLLAEKEIDTLAIVAAWPPKGCGGPPEEAWKRTSKAAGGIPTFVCNQTGNNGMDCTEAESAFLEEGELLFRYHGEEAIILLEVDGGMHLDKKQPIEIIPYP